MSNVCLWQSMEPHFIFKIALLWQNWIGRGANKMLKVSKDNFSIWICRRWSSICCFADQSICLLVQKAPPDERLQWPYGTLSLDTTSDIFGNKPCFCYHYWILDQPLYQFTHEIYFQNYMVLVVINRREDLFFRTPLQKWSKKVNCRI